ncbi:dynein axonemal light chain 1-like [Parasteatoda tepidariorum]|uniref:dynein axonemal light chain 1-like n=1 Tax=Parasteatoda tepidariorum TaxID=114398 RepID=UPI001C7296F4|nr:dynein axonemal light chain 1-like [Parasteatoda tepidariorum]
MGKGVALKDALKKWAEKTGENPAEATVVKLNGWLPSIDKLDPSLATLFNCEKLSLSTNMVDKLTNLNGLTKLKILSVGRNNLKSLNGIEAVAETLEELWASYNSIDKLKPLASLKKLKVLYMSNNNVKDINEFKHMAELPEIEDFVLKGCPIESALAENYRSKVAEALPQLKKLDGTSLIAAETLEMETS